MSWRAENDEKLVNLDSLKTHSLHKTSQRQRKNTSSKPVATVRSMARRKTRRNLASKPKNSRKNETEVLQIDSDKSSSDLSSSESDDELGNLASEISKKIKAKLKSGQKSFQDGGLEGGTHTKESLQFVIDKTPGGHSQPLFGEPGTSQSGESGDYFDQSEDSDSETDEDSQDVVKLTAKKLSSQPDPDNNR